MTRTMAKTLVIEIREGKSLQTPESMIGGLLRIGMKASAFLEHYKTGKYKRTFYFVTKGRAPGEEKARKILKDMYSIAPRSPLWQFARQKDMTDETFQKVANKRRNYGNTALLHDLMSSETKSDLIEGLENIGLNVYRYEWNEDDKARRVDFGGDFVIISAQEMDKEARQALIRENYD